MNRLVGSAKQVKGTVKQVVCKAVGDTKLERHGSKGNRRRGF
jgi:uncharacterized protein YjbJ (UPF0337 family)